MNIELFLPEKTVEINYFFKLLSKLNHHNETSKPHISFVSKPIVDPQILFEGFSSEKACFNVGKLPICFNTVFPKTINETEKHPEILNKKDKLGEYLEVRWPELTYYQLNLKQLYDRIKNNVVSLDHVGININPKLLSKPRYKIMKQLVSESNLLWNYPRKEWPFLIFENDPKFEFAYDFNFPYPEIQLDIQTNLSSKEVISMFPKPYGYYNPTSFYGKNVVSVFIYTGWQNTSLRIDLRFKISNFSHTEWLLSHCTKVNGVNLNKTVLT